MPSLSSLFLSSNPGSLAQAMPLAVLLGGVILLVYKLIDWRVPLFYLATISLLSIFLPGGDKILGHTPHLLGNPLLHIIAGVFTMIIRYYTPYPDGAAFGVLLANAMVPAIDNYMLKSEVSAN